MTSFAEQMQGITIRNAKTITIEPSKIYWHNGERRSKSGGSFYARQSDFPQGLPTPPWQPEQRFEGEQGFVANSVMIAPITYRQQAFRKYKDADGKDRVEWLQKWEQGATIYTELLCLLKDYDEPVVWACKGLTGKAVTGKGGILQTYQSGLLKEAIRLAGQGLPLCAFWLPIETKRTADGKVAYEDTGFGSFVTPPSLVLPPNAVDTLFVGGEALQRADEVLRQYGTWEQQKRLPENTVEGEVVGVPQLPAPAHRNVPVTIPDSASIDEY